FQGQVGSLHVENCQFRSGCMVVNQIDTDVVSSFFFRNNLFERVWTTFDPLQSSFEARNNLFKNGSLYISPQYSAASAWLFTDNLFDGITLDQGNDITANYN